MRIKKIIPAHFYMFSVSLSSPILYVISFSSLPILLCEYSSLNSNQVYSSPFLMILRVLN